MPLMSGSAAAKSQGETRTSLTRTKRKPRLFRLRDQLFEHRQRLGIRMPDRDRGLAPVGEREQATELVADGLGVAIAIEEDLALGGGNTGLARDRVADARRAGARVEEEELAPRTTLTTAAIASRSSDSAEPMWLLTPTAPGTASSALARGVAELVSAHRLGERAWAGFSPLCGSIGR